MSVSRSDVAIIGAGPVGLFAVFECGMLKMRCQVVDALESVGGQCAALYPEKPIYDIPGYPRIGAMELIDRLSEQAAPFAPTYHLNQRVDTLARDGDDWTLTTSAGTVLRARGDRHRRRRRRVRPEPAAAGRPGRLRRQERVLSGQAARGSARQARRHRRRRRLGGGLDAVARRRRRAGHGRPSPRQVPRGAGQRRQAQGAGAGRQDRHGRALPARRARRQRRPAFGRDLQGPRRRHASGWRPTCCCRSSAWR